MTGITSREAPSEPLELRLTALSRSLATASWCCALVGVASAIAIVVLASIPSTCIAELSELLRPEWQAPAMELLSSGRLGHILLLCSFALIPWCILSTAARRLARCSASGVDQVTESGAATVETGAPSPGHRQASLPATGDSAIRRVARAMARVAAVMFFLWLNCYGYPWLRSFASSRLCIRPSDLAVDEAGRYWVLSARGGPGGPDATPRLFIFTSDGRLANSITLGSSSRRPRRGMAFALGPSGEVYVCERRSGRYSIYKTSRNGTMEPFAHWQGRPLRDVLCVGDEVHTMDSDSLVRHFDSDTGVLRGEYQLPDIHRTSNLVRIGESGLAACSADRVLFIRGVAPGCSALTFKMERYRMVGSVGDNLIAVHSCSPLAPRCKLTKFRRDGTHLRKRELPPRFALARHDRLTPPAVASGKGALVTLNLVPYRIHVFDPELKCVNTINVCNNWLLAEAAHFENVLTDSYSGFGVLGFIEMLGTGRITSRWHCALLSLGVFGLIHYALRKAYNGQYPRCLFVRRFPLTPYILPWFAVLVLFVRLATLPLAPRPEAAPAEQPTPPQT